MHISCSTSALLKRRPRIQSAKTYIASFPKLFFLQPQQHSLFLFYCSFKIFISAFEELYSGLGVWQCQKRSLCSTKLFFRTCREEYILSQPHFQCLYRFLLPAVKTNPEMKLISVKVKCVILARIRFFTFW